MSHYNNETKIGLNVQAITTSTTTTDTSIDTKGYNEAKVIVVL